MQAGAGSARVPLTRVLETDSRAFSSSLFHGRPLHRDARGALFAPGQVFVQLLVQGPPGARGRHAIVAARAVDPGRPAVRLLGVAPGAELLLRAGTTPACRKARAAFRLLEEEGINPSDASPAWFRDFHARLAMRMEPPPYTRARHEAHLALERTGGWPLRAAGGPR